MKRWVLAAGLIAATVVSPAAAADLGDGTPWRDGAYGDPHYPPHAGPPPSYYDDDDDDNDAYDAPRRRRYSHAPRGYEREDCVKSEQVRRRLTRRGWRDFQGGKPVSDGVVTLRARRPSGRLFELKLDRCSGDLIATRPLELRPFGPYAYREPDRPYSRPWRADAPPHADDDRWRERPYAYRDQRRWD